MDDVHKIIEILVDALLLPRERKRLIGDFQRIVWSGSELLIDQKVLDIILDLAYDLDFYEPDPSKRAEDPSYYGDERAEEEIRSGLDKLRKEGISIPKGGSLVPGLGET